MIVEGKQDRAALLRHLVPSALVKVANGKDRLIAAYDGLESHLREQVIFLIDCDDEVPQRLKGKLDLVISSNRDMDADLVIEMGAFSTAALAVLGEQGESGGWVAEAAQLGLSRSLSLAVAMGIVVKFARERGLPCRVKIARKGIDRPLSLEDLEDVDFHQAAPISISRVANSFGRAMEWGDRDIRLVLDSSEALFATPCAAHGVRCEECMSKTFANGHQVVDALAGFLSTVHGAEITAPELARALRLAVTPSHVSEWNVAKRIRDWQTVTGLELIQAA